MPFHAEESHNHNSMNPEAYAERREEEVPPHIKVIQSLSSAPRSPSTIGHFFTMMLKNLRQKSRTPVSTILETILPVIFVLGLVFIWLAVEGGAVPAKNFLENGVVVQDVWPQLLQATCSHPNHPYITGLRNCTTAEASSFTCYPNHGLPVSGLCSSFTGLGNIIPWLGFKTARYVPSIDEMILMQWLAKVSASYETRDNSYNQPLGGLLNSGLLHFAPDTPAVRTLRDSLNQTSSLFKYVSGTVFPSSKAAEEWVIANENVDKSWAILVLESLNTAAGSSGLDLTIRMNRSGIPWTNQVKNVGNGIGTFATATYLASGFMTLQDEVSRYFTAQLPGSSPQLPRTVHVPMPYTAYDSSPFLTLIGALAPLFLVFGYLYPVSQLVKRIVEEKEQRVREAMMIMGLSTGPFYCSWVFTYFIFQLITALVAAGILKGTMLPKSDFVIIFFLFFLFGLSNITLSSVISGFFSKSRIAAIVSPVVFFIFSVPSFALPDTTPASTMVVISLLSPTAFANGMRVLVDLEISGGARDYNINDSFNGYPMPLVYFMLVLDTILYMLLTLYIDAVLPSEWGTRAHPCFCVVNPYRWWKRRQAAQSGENAEARDGRDPNGAFEPVTPGQKPSVELRGLHKEFDLPNGTRMTAVNDLTLNMYENQVLALLGHNGAGKTTAMNLMTGMLEVDSGDCYFHGYSVVHDLDKVRREVGFCPQHNILWPELTCREHLHFFARLKGLDGEKRQEAVEAMLIAVDLADKADKFPNELSGGQKRKLSVGIAFVGGSRVVFLDEPTAGMDVAARRHTWELIKHMTPGRTIVLTTHYMDEADLLGNTIAIMAKGRLKCAGSSMFLKSRLGVGYALTITCEHGATNTHQVISAVQGIVPTADLLGNAGGEVTLRLPMECVPQFPQLLRHLEDNAQSLGLRGHGISVTTLEEIFLKLGHDDEEEAAQQKAADSHQSAVPVDPEANQLMWNPEINAARSSNLGQFIALFTKRFHYAKRDTRTIVMQAVLPVICILFAMLLTLIKFPDAPKLPIGPGLYPGERVTSAYSGCPPNWGSFTVNDTDNVNANLPDSLAFSTYLLNTAFSHPRHRIGSHVCRDTFLNATTSIFFSNTSIYRHSAPQALSELHTANMRYKSQGMVNTQIANHPFPLSAREQAFVNAITTVFISLFVMIPFTFVPSTFVSFIVKERETRALQLQVASGLRYMVYWASNFCFDIMSFVVTSILVIIIFAIFGRGEYVGTGELFGATFLLFMLYGGAGVGGSYIMSFFFESHSTAQNIVMLVNFICGFMLVLLAYILSIIESTKSAGEALKYIFRVVPSYCLGEGILNLANRKLAENFGGADAAFDMKVVGWPMLYLALEIPIFMLVVLYLDSPLRRSQQHAITRDSDDAPVEMIENEDDDVAIERREIESGARDSTDLVVVKNFRKVYTGNKEVVAVKNLSFGVHRGEVFGFLGTNGAGKTTTISILCGEQTPTRGHGWIAGKDVVSQAAETRNMIGYCPQFDALHDLLTVEEHLVLYAGLHGLEGQMKADVINRLIHVCGLDEHRSKESRSLSGGNKRKLSVAISLLGAPQVVFLDEPSAGMDPMARRQLWDVIEQIATHCSVVLTTHHLEEVEALATRMGIMVDGELKCVGPLQHLKTKFGSGFEMSLRVRKDNQVPALEDFVRGNIPEAVIQELRGTKMTVALPQMTKLSNVFQLLEGNKDVLGITDYSISQTSLESVFLRISADAKNTED